MKAKIYGHEIEGTPEEIIKFKQHLDDQIAKLTKPNTYEYKVYPPVYIGNPTIPSFQWNQVTCKASDYQSWN